MKITEEEADVGPLNPDMLSSCMSCTTTVVTATGRSNATGITTMLTTSEIGRHQHNIPRFWREFLLFLLLLLPKLRTSFFLLLFFYRERYFEKVIGEIFSLTIAHCGIIPTCRRRFFRELRNK